MTSGEEFYPALKKLIEFPEWKVFEQYLKAREKDLLELFLMGENSGEDIQSRVRELRKVLTSIQNLIGEVEASHKLKQGVRYNG